MIDEFWEFLAPQQALGSPKTTPVWTQVWLWCSEKTISPPQDSRQEENTTLLSSLLQILEIPCARNCYSYVNPTGWPTRSGQREHLITPSNQTESQMSSPDADIQPHSLGYSTAVTGNSQSTVNKHSLSTHKQTTVAEETGKAGRESQTRFWAMKGEPKWHAWPI